MVAEPASYTIVALPLPSCAGITAEFSRFRHACAATFRTWPIHRIAARGREERLEPWLLIPLKGRVAVAVNPDQAIAIASLHAGGPISKAAQVTALRAGFTDHPYSLPSVGRCFHVATCGAASHLIQLACALARVAPAG